MTTSINKSNQETTDSNMTASKFIFLREALDRYQQHSNRALHRIQHQLPHHLDAVAELMDKSSYSLIQVCGRKTRSLKEISTDFAETIKLSNDYACDKAQEVIRTVEQKRLS